MDATGITLNLTAGLIMLFIGAEGLIRGASSLALRAGITPLVVGLTVVAFGTSSPELVVSINAALDGKGDISLGNVIGSNIANIALILGIAAMIRPMKVQAQVISREIPIMIGVTLLLVLFLLDLEIGFIEGIIFCAGITGYTILSIYLAKKENQQEVKDEFEEGVAKKPLNIWLALLFVAAGLALLVYGANMFVTGAVAIAEILGMSQAVIGLTIVAVGTSLPELITSSVAAFKKEADIAIGNVVGSNVFNILLIIGLSAVIVNISAAGITMTDMIVMMVTAVILLPLSRTGFVLNRIEGALLVTGYAIYIYTLMP